MKKNITKYFILIFSCFLLKVGVVKASWADCYVQKQNDSKVSIGEIFTYELGTAGFTHGTQVYGIHYELEFDPDVLEPIIEKNVGVSSYYSWENISATIVESPLRYDKLVIDMYTNNINNYVKNDNNGFTKLGFVKFKVKNTNETSTKVSLVQTYEEDLVNGQFFGSNSSYKSVYDYEFNQDKSQEPCYTTISTYINIYKKAFLSDIKIDNKTIDNFNKDTYMYNLKSTKKAINISATYDDGYDITGDVGKKSLKYGDNKFSISVTSPSGDKKTYILNINFPDTRSKVNTLKDLTISDGTIEFKSDTTDYNVSVNYNVDKITIDSMLTDSKSSYVTDYGNRDVNLNVGNNVVLIKVKAENGDEKTYTLNLTREESTQTCDIKSLTVDGYDLTFNPEISNYKLTINPNETSLKLSVELMDKESKYIISGNENLDNGSTITIKVEDKNGKENNYYINVLKDTIVEEQNEENNLLPIIIIASIVVVLVVGLIIIFTKRKK